MITQSVGVPFTAKRRSPISRSRSGSLSESECETPDWSNSGASTQTSSESARPISAQTSSPSEWMPSSLVMRIRMACDEGVRRTDRAACSARASTARSGLSCAMSSRSLDDLQAAHIALQHVGDRNRAALLLVGFHHCDERAADGDPRAVERVHMPHCPAALGAVARVHAPGLKLAAQRAGGNLAIHVLSGQPDLDVIGLLRGKAHVARAQGGHAVVQIEPAQHLFGAGEHALEFVATLLGRGDGDEFDLVELVLADHAARILAGRARLGAKAWRAGGEAHGQRILVEDGFAHQIGQRHLGRGDEPKINASVLYPFPNLMGFCPNKRSKCFALNVALENWIAPSKRSEERRVGKE